MNDVQPIWADKFIDIIEKNDPKNYEVLKDENKNFYS